MNKCLDAFRSDIIVDTLRTFKNNTRSLSIIKKVDPELMEHLKICGLTENMINNFYVGNMSEERAEGMFCFLAGCFASFRAYKYVQSLGAKNIKREVPCQGTKVDMVATLSGNEIFKTVLPDLWEAFCCQKAGVHAFEVKGTCKIKKSAKEQINKVKGSYKNCHVLVLADTSVSEGRNTEIRKEGADILKFDSTKRQIIEEILYINTLKYEFVEKVKKRHKLDVK